MGVPLEHLESLVAANGRHLHWIQPLFEEPAGGLMPEIVEGQIDQKGGIRLNPFLLALFFVDLPSPGYDPDKGMGD